MQYKSLAKHLTITDSHTDRKASIRIGQYRIGKEAVYIPYFPFDKYIPKSAIKSVRTYPSQLSVSCCCGKGVPIVLVLIEYYADQDKLELAKLQLDNQAEADRVLELIALPVS